MQLGFKIFPQKHSRGKVKHGDMTLFIGQPVDCWNYLVKNYGNRTIAELHRLHIRIE